ncbi:hypothetical protein MUP77_16575 [Candidatus Bathyarchaeota archaeon]|nr:hypothetical protein [Candidatus Bathyarchaeota archaeon]
MPLITGLNVHPSVPCYPGTARRQGLSGEKEGSILLFSWVFFGDVFGLVNQIIIELTGDAQNVISLFLISSSESPF